MEMSQESSASKVSYKMDRQGSFSSMGKNLSLYHHVQTGSRAHQDSYPKRIGNTFLGGKATGM